MNSLELQQQISLRHFSVKSFFSTQVNNKQSGIIIINVSQSSLLVIYCYPGIGQRHVFIIATCITWLLLLSLGVDLYLFFCSLLALPQHEGSQFPTGSNFAICHGSLGSLTTGPPGKDPFIFNLIIDNNITKQQVDKFSEQAKR